MPLIQRTFFGNAARERGERRSRPRGRVLLSLSSLSLLLFLAGCGDESGPAGPGPEPEPTTHSWIGRFQSPADGGPLALELVQRGEDVHGEIVLWSPQIASRLLGAEHLYVRGRIRNHAMQLELDMDRVQYQFTFALEASLGPGSELDGTLSFADIVPETQFSARVLERRSIQVAASYVVPTDFKAMVFDGENLLLSTTGHQYLRESLYGNIVGVVEVIYLQRYYWTSDALTWDGHLYWGHLPTTIQDPGGTHNASRIMSFDGNGHIVNEFELPHRAGGLAYDGTSFWALDISWPGMYRYDTNGTILETVPIEVPDPSHLEADPESFWTAGWFMRRLYRLDRAGRATAVYDLPGEGFSFNCGLAREGAAIWYAASTPVEHETALYRLLPE